MGIERWQSRSAPAADPWSLLAKQVAGCQACQLCESRTQTVFGVGDQQADLLIVGEAPGFHEDQQGEPFVGRAGQLLNAMLHAIGLSRQQVYIANVLKCRPPENRDPRPEEVQQCTPYLEQQVALLQPKVMLAVGRIAAHFLLGSNEALSRLRQRQHQFADTPLIVSYHPAYLLRRPSDKGKAWQDLQTVKSLLLAHG